MAWSPDGRRLASASRDNTVRLSDGETGWALRTLEGHLAGVASVAWSTDGRRLASASRDETVRLWDAENGQLLRALEGHSKGVNSVAWSPEIGTNQFATASEDMTIRIWDAQFGPETNILEGHTWAVHCAAFAPDAQLLASKGGSADNTVRLWRCDTWRAVAIIPELSAGEWPPGLAFNPHERVLATVGSDRGTRRGECDRLIHIWQLDYAVLFREERGQTHQISGKTSISFSNSGVIDSVLHATAKIVLVGDSGVGKTGLGWRLAHGEFKHHASTHGQQFWVLDGLGGAMAPAAKRCCGIWPGNPTTD